MGNGKESQDGSFRVMGIVKKSWVDSLAKKKLKRIKSRTDSSTMK